MSALRCCCPLVCLHAILTAGLCICVNACMCVRVLRALFAPVCVRRRTFEACVGMRCDALVWLNQLSGYRRFHSDVQTNRVQKWFLLIFFRFIIKFFLIYFFKEVET